MTVLLVLASLVSACVLVVSIICFVTMVLLVTRLSKPRRPLASGNNTCTSDTYAREPNTPEETQLFEWLQSSATQFAEHLRAHYAQHPMAQQMLMSWNGKVMVSTKNAGATFNRATGCLIINPYYETNKKQQGRSTQGGFDSKQRLLTRLLHELAHSWSGPHDAAFYDAQRWYLRVATEDLGWKVETTCRVCCHYKDNNDCSTACPKCTWIETGCTANHKSCEIT